MTITSLLKSCRVSNRQVGEKPLPMQRRKTTKAALGEAPYRGLYGGGRWGPTACRGRSRGRDAAILRQRGTAETLRRPSRSPPSPPRPGHRSRRHTPARKGLGLRRSISELGWAPLKYWVGRVSFTKTKLNNRPVRVLARRAQRLSRRSAAGWGRPPLNGDEPARRRSWRLEVQQDPWMCHVCRECALAGHWGDGKFRNAAEQIRMSWCLRLTIRRICSFTCTNEPTKSEKFYFNREQQAYSPRLKWTFHDLRGTRVDGIHNRGRVSTNAKREC